MWFVFRLVVVALRAAVRSRADLMRENVALRHQLEVIAGPAAAPASPTRTGASGRRSPARGSRGAGRWCSSTPTPWR